MGPPRLRRPFFLADISQLAFGRETNAEIAKIEREAIARGWLAKDWKELV